MFSFPLQQKKMCIGHWCTMMIYGRGTLQNVFFSAGVKRFYENDFQLKYRKYHFYIRKY